MLDMAPTAQVPGYTGHQPGIVAECLIGRSYAYLTGFRKDLMGSSEAHISEYKRAVTDGTKFEPAKYTPRINASVVARPTNAPDPSGTCWGTQRPWKSKDQYNECLNMSAEGRMPGYTGHVPHFKFQGSIGLPFAKACQVGDHQKPADGSQNTYVHEEPHHKGGKYCDQPVSGYSGYMPFVQTQGGNTNYEHNVATSLQFRSVDILELRKGMDKTNAVYTPSMHKSLEDAATPRALGTPRTAKPENPCPKKTFAVGYGGFVPGTYVLHNSPERYLPKTSTPMDKALATPCKIYLGDLTQEWNVGHPYKTSQESYGAWSPLSKVTEGKPKLWTRRK